MTHADNKAWALRTAPGVAAERGMELPSGVGDDACDAFLQAVWWLEKHTPPALSCMACDEEAPQPSWASMPHCLCCVRRFRSAGLDPSACLTISQLTMRAYKTRLVADLPPMRVVDAETRIVVYEPRSAHRARYMPHEGLAMQPKAEDQMMRKAMRGGRTETGATLYEIANSCRCNEVDETGRRIWNPQCGKSAAPATCPAAVRRA